MKRGKMQTHDGATPHDLVFLISDLQTSVFPGAPLISPLINANSFLHTYAGTRTHTHLPYLALSQPLLPLSSLLAEPLQQLQLLSAPVPLSDLKLMGRKAETAREKETFISGDSSYGSVLGHTRKGKNKNKKTIYKAEVPAL